MPLGIGFFLRSYPEPDEGLIEEQGRALVARGHSVTLHATRSSTPGAEPDPALRPRYEPRAPANRSLRALHGLLLLARSARLGPALPARALFRVLKAGELARTRGSDGFALPYALAALGTASGFDVLHAHGIARGLAVRALQQLGLLQAPLLVSVSGSDSEALWAPVAAEACGPLFRARAWLLPASQELATRLVELGANADQVRLERVGVDLRKLAFHVPSREPRQKLVTLARLVAKKGIDDALRALARLPRRVRYDVLGDGPERARLEALARELGLSGRVRFHGWRSRAEALARLQEADLLLAPSVVTQSGEREAIPSAILEAMALGVPVVSTRHAGIPELIADGVSGMLVAERSPTALAARLRFLLESPGEREQLACNARAVVARAHDLDTQTARLVATYELARAALAPRGPAPGVSG